MTYIRNFLRMIQLKFKNIYLAKRQLTDDNILNNYKN